jgi:hypothetical protein
MAESAPQYRLVVFETIDEPHAVRDLFCRETGLHPTDAILGIARLPGTWPRLLSEPEVRRLLDGLYDLGVAAEAWRTDAYPDLTPPRTIHAAACLPEGFRVKGLRGEPTHWVPWDKIELIGVGRIHAEDEYRSVSPPTWPSALVTGIRATVFRRPEPSSRRARAQRVPRDPIGEAIIIRRDPRLALRVVENQMNYASLGDRLRPSASENFPILVAVLCAQSQAATLTPATQSFLEGREPGEHDFPSSQALFDDAILRLLWSWYRRDRDADRPTSESGPP